MRTKGNYIRILVVSLCTFIMFTLHAMSEENAAKPGIVVCQYLKTHSPGKTFLTLGRENGEASNGGAMPIVLSEANASTTRFSDDMAEIYKRVMASLRTCDVELAKLDANAIDCFLLGAKRMLDAIEASSPVDGLACGLAVRTRLMRAMGYRLVSKGEKMPAIGTFLLQNPCRNERFKLTLKALKDRFPAFKTELGQLAPPLSYGDLYALYQLEKDRGKWPDKRKNIEFVMRQDPSRDIGAGLTLSGFAAILLNHEMERQAMEAIVDLSKAMKTIPENKDEIVAAAKQHVRAVREQEEYPSTDGKITPETVWKMCHYARQMGVRFYSSASQPALMQGAK